jgi:hypothetical protein
MKIPIVIGTVAGSVLIVKTVMDWANSAANNFWHKMKFAIDPSSIKVAPKLATTKISANLDIDNNYTLSTTLSKVHLTVFYEKTINEKPVLYELARTAPTNATFPILANKRNTIEGLSIEINNLTTAMGIATILAKPAGKRVLIKIGGLINGIPFETEYWY